MCLSQSEASGIVFYTQDFRELAFHIVFVAIRSPVYCLQRITQDFQEFAFHIVFVTIRSLVYCFLHSIAGSGHVIVCLSQPEASCVVVYIGLAGVGLS